jgi:hypothetical protein
MSNFMCSTCNRDFITERGRNQHQRIAHKSRAKVHVQIAEASIEVNGKRVGYIKHLEWEGDEAPPLADFFPKAGG